ncbi:MAG: universal stress protein, partial [Psychroserpens sp.]|nr:universal stress protein [Psychroserpens sp.]
MKNHVAQVNSRGVEISIKTFKGKLIDTIELAAKTL